MHNIVEGDGRINYIWSSENKFSAWEVDGAGLGSLPAEEF
jgi:hypothetical protein